MKIVYSLIDSGSYFKYFVKEKNVISRFQQENNLLKFEQG